MPEDPQMSKPYLIRLVIKLSKINFKIWLGRVFFIFFMIPITLEIFVDTVEICAFIDKCLSTVIKLINKINLFIVDSYMKGVNLLLSWMENHCFCFCFIGMQFISTSRVETCRSTLCAPLKKRSTCGILRIVSLIRYFANIW